MSEVRSGLEYTPEHNQMVGLILLQAVMEVATERGGREFMDNLLAEAPPHVTSAEVYSPHPEAVRILNEMYPGADAAIIERFEQLSHLNRELEAAALA